MSTFPDGCIIPDEDDHCSCINPDISDEWCGTTNPCCRHDPDLHDPQDDSLYGKVHRIEVTVHKHVDRLNEIPGVHVDYRCVLRDVMRKVNLK
jgi:hypothetical protein